MLVYLDANIVQYCADFDGYLSGDSRECPVVHSWLRGQLEGLRQLIELDQHGHWDFAAPEELLRELHRGRPTREQGETYPILERVRMTPEPDRRRVDSVSACLIGLGLSRADRRQLATAAAMGASWFITCDQEIVRRVADNLGGCIGPMCVAHPSSAVQEIRVALSLR